MSLEVRFIWPLFVTFSFLCVRFIIVHNSVAFTLFKIKNVPHKATWQECEQKLPIAVANPEKRFDDESSERGMQLVNGGKRSSRRKTPHPALAAYLTQKNRPRKRAGADDSNGKKKRARIDDSSSNSSEESNLEDPSEDQPVHNRSLLPSGLAVPPAPPFQLSFKVNFELLYLKRTYFFGIYLTSKT